VDTLSLYRLFKQVVDSKSFKAAADNLGIPSSQATRGIQRLEEELGVQLLVRTTRMLKPTESGWYFYENITPLLENLSALQQSLLDRESTPQGVLAITVTPTFGRACLLSAIAEFTKEYPKISFKIDMSDQNVDLSRHHYDVAFRIGELGDERWVSREIAKQELVFCAAPSYLDNLEPRYSPENISQLTFLVHPDLAFVKDYIKENRALLGLEPTSSVLEINDVYALYQAALSGMGCTLLPTYLIKEDLEDGRLRLLPHGFPVPVRDVHMLYPAIRPLPIRIRTFVDFIKKYFKDTPQ